MKAMWLRSLQAAAWLVAAGNLPAQNAVTNAPTAPPPGQAPAAAAPGATPGALDSKKVQDSLLIVTSKAGSGSGFIANLGGAPTLITNAHVIAGATRLEIRQLSGAVLQPGKGRMGVGADVAAFAAPANVSALELAADVSKEVAIGDEVVIYGNSLGQSVATEIRGKVVGIGPDVIEVDAPFVPGNSGSPIIQVKSGKVIGIASYITTEKHDKWSKDSGVAEMRRFGYRLDTIPRWDDLNWPLFQSEAALVLGIEAFTDDYVKFMINARDHKGLVSSNPRIQRHIRDLQRDTESTRGKIQNQDIAKAITSFLWDLKSEAKQEFIPGRPVPRYWFTNHEWNEQKEIREAISKDLDQTISERNTLSR
ncbi:hypothetical protein BH09VER1_BH09VER1_02460 [soil metagenome]